MFTQLYTQSLDYELIIGLWINCFPNEIMVPCDGVFVFFNYYVHFQHRCNVQPDCILEVTFICAFVSLFILITNFSFVAAIGGNEHRKCSS